VAWKFISWFMQPEVYGRWVKETGQFPQTKSVAKMPEFAQHPIFSVFFSQPNVVAPPELPNLYELELTLGKHLEKAIYNNTPAKQALDVAAADMNALLKQVPEYLLPKK
jgi:ABC-type glycerol-3-phosphate transport system substrate-binding protein